MLEHLTPATPAAGCLATSAEEGEWGEKRCRLRAAGARVRRA